MAVAGESAFGLEATGIYKIYRSFINPMLNTRWKRWTFMISIVIILLGSLSLFYTKSVALKMLPFDNKNEFQVLIDMPEGSTLENKRGSTGHRRLCIYAKLVRNYQAYAGTGAYQL